MFAVWSAPSVANSVCGGNTNDGNISHVNSCNRTRLETPVVTEPGLFRLLLNIGTKKEMGARQYTQYIPKRYAEWLAKYLCLIFNKSLSTCRLPQDWKVTKFIPVRKFSDKAEVSNYKPISLTSSVSKLLEHTVNKSIIIYLEEESFLSPYQHGFQKVYTL